MYCMYCGSEMPEGAMYCSRCGKRLHDVPHTAVKEERSESAASLPDKENVSEKPRVSMEEWAEEKLRGISEAAKGKSSYRDAEELFRFQTRGKSWKNGSIWLFLIGAVATLVGEYQKYDLKTVTNQIESLWGNEKPAPAFPWSEIGIWIFVIGLVLFLAGTVYSLLGQGEDWDSREFVQKHIVLSVALSIAGFSCRMIGDYMTKDLGSQLENLFENARLNMGPLFSMAGTLLLIIMGAMLLSALLAFVKSKL